MPRGHRLFFVIFCSSFCLQGTSNLLAQYDAPRQIPGSDPGVYPVPTVKMPHINPFKVFPPKARHSVPNAATAVITPQKIPHVVDVVIKALSATIFVDQNIDYVKLFNQNAFSEQLVCFYGNGMQPSISPQDYFYRFFTYNNNPGSVSILALIYIQRFITLYGAQEFNRITCYRIALGAFVVASKYLDDYSPSMKCFAKLGGISQAEILSLEIAFLNLLHFEITVLPNEYALILKNLLLTFLLTKKPIDFDQSLDLTTEAFAALTSSSDPIIELTQEEIAILNQLLQH
jgi:hypothetical protein